MFVGARMGIDRRDNDIAKVGDIAGTVAARYADIADRSGEIVPENGMLQTMREMEKIKLGG